MSTQSNETWQCPYCKFVVPYGKSCPHPDPKQCTEASKNIHWDQLWLNNKVIVTNTIGVGISEIASSEKD